MSAGYLPRARSDLAVCGECDAVYPRLRLATDDVARCRRCGTTLERGHWLSIDGQLALTLAALVTFLIGGATPIVTLELSGIPSVATLLQAIQLTWAAGERLVALLAAATAFAFPMVVIALRLWVLVPAMRARRASGLVPVMRTLHWVMRWSMVEVFMLGVLVAVVRGAGVTSLVFGPGIFAFASLTVMLTAIQATGIQGLWDQLAPVRPPNYVRPRAGVRRRVRTAPEVRL